MKKMICISNFLSFSFIVGAIYYLARYLNSPDHPLRHELLVGVALCLTFGFWPALFSAGLTVYERDNLSKFVKAISLSFLPIIVISYILFRTIET